MKKKNEVLSTFIAIYIVHSYLHTIQRDELSLFAKKSTHASLEILLPSVVSVTFFIFFFSRVKNGQFVFKVDIYV